MGKVFFLKGNFKQRTQRIKQIREDLGFFDQYVFDEKNHINRVTQQISEFSCFSDTRLIILNGIPYADVNLKREKILKKLAGALLGAPDDCTIVLNNLDIKAKSFHNAIAPVTKDFIYENIIETRGLKQWLSNYFKQHKVLEKPEDTNRIFSTLKGNEYRVAVDDIHAFCEKLLCLSGKKKKIPSAVVDVVCSDYDLFLINSFCAALDEKDESQALYIINARIADKPNLEEEIIKLVYLLAKRYDLLIVIISYLLAKNECDFLRDKHIVYTDDIWSHIKKIKKLERLDGSGVKTRMGFKPKKADDTPEETEEKAVTYFNEKQARFMINGFGYERPTVHYYRELIPLYTIQSVIQKAIYRLRVKHTHYEILVLLGLLAKVICKREALESDLKFFDTPYRFIKM